MDTNEDYELLEKQIDKRLKERQIINVLHDLIYLTPYVSEYQKKYKKIKSEKRVRNVHIAKEYLKVALVSGSALATAYLMNLGISLDLVVHSLNATAVGGTALFEINKDRIPEVSLNKKELKDFFYEYNQLYEDYECLLLHYSESITDYVPFYKLEDDKSFIDELDLILKNNKYYIESRLNDNRFKFVPNISDVILFNCLVFGSLESFENFVMKEKMIYDAQIKLKDEARKIRKIKK